MFFYTAEGFRFFGDGRKDQHVSGTEHNQTHHGAYDPPPYFFAFFKFQF
jgi:hypothetical protein